MIDNNKKIFWFWQKYLSSLPEEEQKDLKMPDAWAFGEGEEMADELGGLVLKGMKTATASLLWEYEAEGSPLPEPGGLSIILDGQEKPICLIETVSVEVKPFNLVDEKFAFAEGEGDRSLAYWREAHWRFFRRTCAVIGREPSKEMPVVCERFHLIFRSY